MPIRVDLQAGWLDRFGRVWFFDRDRRCGCERRHGAREPFLFGGWHDRGGAERFFAGIVCVAPGHARRFDDGSRRRDGVSARREVRQRRGTRGRASHDEDRQRRRGEGAPSSRRSRGAFESADRRVEPIEHARENPREARPS